jgi:signal transduction histidine kinase
MNASSTTNGERPVTILVVDDDPKVTFVVSEFLEAVNYNVIICSCGAEALKSIEQQPIDLVLLDIIMPGIDGYTVAKRMKSFFGKDNFVPIIMLTGVTGINEKIAGLENADDLITKPFSHRELLARIAVMLRIRSLHLELVVSRSRHVKLEQEQRDARKKLYLSARLASIGTLAAGVAHELNNPLTAVLGFSSALLARLRENRALDRDEFMQYLGFINSATLRCRDIIETLSKFAREKGIRIVPFAIKECIEQSLKLINSKARKKNITFTSEIPDSIIVKTDSQRIEQVLIQVFSNSIDFCAPGGAVSITAKNDGDSVFLSIIDNGPGIPAEIIPKVFDPFFTTKEVGAGAGLGLAICHHIMEECNGAISVESEGKMGTKVLIEIPQG